jgi:hypothetical protein
MASIKTAVHVFGRWRNWWSWRKGLLGVVKRRGVSVLAWNFSVTRSTVAALETRSLAYRLKIPPAKNLALHYTEVGRSLQSCESSKMERASSPFWRLEFEDGS